MPRPRIVCLCGSTKFGNAYRAATFAETMAGKIVLSVGGYMHDNAIPISPEQKHMLDHLHLHKIDMADEVLILNVNGYIGESSARELAYAVYARKDVNFLERVAGEQYMLRERHMLGKLIATFMEQGGGPHLAPRKDRTRGTIGREF